MNAEVFEDIDACPVCGSDHISLIDHNRKSYEIRENWCCDDCDADWDVVFSFPKIERVYVLDTDKSVDGLQVFTEYKGALK